MRSLCVDEDDEMAALAHQQELEERCRQLQKELNDETKVFEETNKQFWDNLRTYEQERHRADHRRKYRR